MAYWKGIWCLIMPNVYPKFDQKINDQITNARMQVSRPRTGTIVSYDRYNDTITVILESQYSDTVGNIVANIPCPSIYRSSVSRARTR